MATATRNKPSKSAKKVDYTFGCKFGNLNIGEDVCRIGVKIDRSKLSPSKAAELFCSRRLTITLVIEPGAGETDAIPGLESPLKVKGVFDTKSFGVSSKSIAAGLTGSLKDVELDDLARFPKNEGRIEIAMVDHLPDEIEPDDTPIE